MINYSDCKNVIFISYAFDDDAGEWITNFKKEIEKQLLTIKPNKKVQLLDRDNNFLTNGNLSEVLEEEIKNSYALIIIAHKHYAKSDYCLDELKYFIKHFGQVGLKTRLFILVLSEDAMKVLETKNREWPQLISKDQIWIPFYDKSSTDKPIDIYGSRNDGTLTTSPQFLNKMQTIADKLITQINNELLDLPQRQPDHPKFQAKRIIIIGPTSKDLDQTCNEFETELEKIPNIEIRRIDRAIFKDGDEDVDNIQIAASRIKEKLKNADIVIQVFNNYPPILGVAQKGGHLSLIEENANPNSKIYWVDCQSNNPASKTASEIHMEKISELRKKSRSYEESISEIRKHFQSPETTTRSSKAAILYIETNSNHRDEWKYLHQRIEEICRENNISLKIRPRALPVEDPYQVSRMNFENVNGIVLLWGQKDQSAIFNHVDHIDGIITQKKSSIVPGIIAYLTPPAERREKPIEPSGWDVARFDNTNPSTIHEFQEDIDLLKYFLESVKKQSNF